MKRHLIVIITAHALCAVKFHVAHNGSAANAGRPFKTISSTD